MPEPTNYHPEPCPFCGSANTRAREVLSSLLDYRSRWMVSCDDCRAQGPMKESLVHAVEAWNKGVPRTKYLFIAGFYD